MSQWHLPPQPTTEALLLLGPTVFTFQKRENFAYQLRSHLHHHRISDELARGAWDGGSQVMSLPILATMIVRPVVVTSTLTHMPSQLKSSCQEVHLW